MANSDMHLARAREQDIVLEYGSFVAAAANPTVFDGIIRSAVRDSAGQFTFTLKRKYPQVRFAEVQVLGTAGGRGFVEAIDPKAGTITVQLYTLADAAGDLAGSTVLLKIEFKNSTVTRR